MSCEFQFQSIFFRKIPRKPRCLISSHLFFRLLMSGMQSMQSQGFSTFGCTLFGCGRTEGSSCFASGITTFRPGGAVIGDGDFQGIFFIFAMHGFGVVIYIYRYICIVTPDVFVFFVGGRASDDIFRDMYKYIIRNEADTIKTHTSNIFGMVSIERETLFFVRGIF